LINHDFALITIKPASIAISAVDRSVRLFSVACLRIAEIRSGLSRNGANTPA
jgi:hypothetical protein